MRSLRQGFVREGASLGKTQCEEYYKSDEAGVSAADNSAQSVASAQSLIPIPGVGVAAVSNDDDGWVKVTPK